MFVEILLINTGKYDILYLTNGIRRRKTETSYIYSKGFHDKGKIAFTYYGKSDFFMQS